MTSNHDATDLAVVGVAGRFPGARDVGEFWRNLRQGVESISVLDEDDLREQGIDPDLIARPEYVRAASMLDEPDLFDAAFFGYNGREAAILDPQQRLFLETSWHALEDAGHVPGAFGGCSEATVGVYAASNLSTYLISNVLAGRDLRSSAEGLEFLLANDKDYIANRVSYKLGLEGPAVGVQSACSSSLVAVHMGAQALLAFECDVVVAGGVALRVPHRAGYLYQEGLIFSPDGRCRPFDAQANGTIPGNGAGAVVLKRLEDAHADGDRIHAILKGSAVNNDGSVKVGYTAPSIDGQAQVVANALGVADIHPDTVTAIEAHGTGTQLGDPIEVAALRKVFGAGEDRKSPCLIGSVKSNIGHLDSAAGVTGLVKAILQLKHAELAPSLNYAVSNPEIDFASTPFEVPTETRAWKANGDPRRIGVSSFGMGGTNAHLLLEEAPAPDSTREQNERSRDVHVLPLSAASPDALRAARTDLAAALLDEDPPELPDVARTLQVSRAGHRYRSVLLARSRTEAAAALEDPDSPQVASSIAQHVTVTWMFPGQGSQYPDMASGLYSAEPVFRKHVDSCCEGIADSLGLDLREVLMPSLFTDGGYERAADRLRQTAVAQPALFTVEYALAQLLRSWGQWPDAMVGHSIGEVVAACLCGVFSLDDALHLVEVRGRLMQQQPTGGMLSVALPEDGVRELLPRGLSLAAVNAPDLAVVSGSHDDIAAFREHLSDRDVPTRELHTSHAFHSAMMEPMLERFASELGRISFHPPRYPYVSNRTGTWISAQQATDPDYWVRHVRDTVRFGDAVDLLGRNGRAVLVEVGPGHTLGTLARQTTGVRGATTVSTLPAPDDHWEGVPREGSDGRSEEEGERGPLDHLLEAVGRMWLAGVDIHWDAVDGAGLFTDLPLYPFQRRRYWVEPPRRQADSSGFDVDIPDEGAEEDAALSGLVLASDPRPNLTTPYLEARDQREEWLVALWQELLGVEPVGVHDNFIELGGHSLLAARLVDRIKSYFGVEVSLRALLATPTVAGVAELVGQVGGTSGQEADGLPRAVRDLEDLYEPFPLTEIQQAQWIGRMGNFNVGDVAAHVYWEIDGADIDLERLESCFNVLMDRHYMLRAIVTHEGQQCFLPHVGPYRIDVLDLRDASQSQRDDRLAELRDRLSKEVRATDTWPLFDIRATLLPGGRFRLHLGFDLLIADIGSISILMRDWRKLYEGRDDELAPLDLSFRDYAIAASQVRDTRAYQRSLDYWRERVQELPAGPELPLATAPESLGRPEFAARSAIIDADTWDQLVQRSARSGVTPSAVLLAAYALVLGRWCRSGRFTLNVTVTNRLPLHEDVGNLVGEFASFDLLPVDLTERLGVDELARRLQEQSWQDLEYRYLNGVEVLREMARRSGGTSGAVMPVVFTSTLAQESEPGEDSMFAWLGETTHEVAQTPQVWMDAGVLHAAEGMQLSWHGVRDLFPDGVLDRMFDAWHGLLLELATDQVAWSPDAHDLLPGPDRALIEQTNDTAGPVPDGLLFTPLLEQVTRQPQQPAVVTSARTLTYGELHGHACRVARRLRGLGVGPNRLVAVSTDKSAEQIVAALAVLLAGGAYLPVDPDLPGERQDWLVEHGQARIVLTRAGGPVRTWPEGMRVIAVDVDTELDEAEHAPEAVQVPADLAYVIFTSGSTGTPKGVMLSHQAALNTMVDINERFGVGPDDRVLGLSALSFDLSVWDVFGVLGAGGALVLPEPEASRDPARWLELVGQHRVTVWNSVPALMQMFVEYLPGGTAGDASTLRLALLSGDWIPLDLPDRLRQNIPDIDVVSLGGATEAAVWSIAYSIGAVDRTWDSIPYGKPLRNQTFHVLNDRMQPCPVWVTGELYIGGRGVAEGYWRDAERTSEHFVADPHTGERMYRTGDLGRWLPDGNIEFLGREDFQIKIGGFRIELGEIEAALLRHEGVRSAVVNAVGDRHHQRLVAYLVPEQDRTGEEAAVVGDTEGLGEELCAEARVLAERVLPHYMVPGAFVTLGQLPLTANGKIDRGGLPDPGGHAEARGAAGALGAAAGAIAAQLTAIIAEVLGVQSVDVTDNFFAIGGDSILGIQVVSRANGVGFEISAADLFEQRTIADLAALLDERGAGKAMPAASDISVPLTPDQRRRVLRAAPDLPESAHCIELTVAAELDISTLGEALKQVLDRNPALRLRLAESAPGRGDGADGEGTGTSYGDGYDGTTGWIQSATEEDPEATSVAFVPLDALPPERRETAMRHLVVEMGAELDPVRGPVTKAALFNLGSGEYRLAWLVHEIAADQRSWPILIEDLHLALGRIRRGEHPDAPDMRAGERSFFHWAGEFRGELDVPAPAGIDLTGTETHVLDLGAAEHSQQSEATAWIDAGDTRALLDSAADAYRLTSREVVLSALTRALQAHGLAGRKLVEVEHDLRVDGPYPSDTLHVVGPYASVVPVPLDLTVGPEVGAVLDTVKETARSVAARCVYEEFNRDGQHPTGQSQLLLVHLGTLDPYRHGIAIRDDFVHFTGTLPERVGVSTTDHPVTVTTYLAEGKLHVRCRCLSADAGIAASLAEAVVQGCRDVAEHCQDPRAGSLSPSDFPLAGLDNTELAAVAAALEDETGAD